MLKGAFFSIPQGLGPASEKTFAYFEVKSFPAP